MSLFDPARWSSSVELSPGERVIAAVAVLAASVIVASLAGFLSGRWMERAGKVVRAERIRRGVMLLSVVGGAYFASELFPLPAHLATIMSGVLFVLAALIAARLAIHIVSVVVTTSVSHVGESERERVEREYVPVVDKLMTLAVGLIVMIVVAKHFGQDLTSLVAALGLGSLAIGLAAQQTLGNMFAGFVLLVDRPFRPGDRIKLATGESGEVLEVGVRSTRILLADRNLLIVPNTELANSRVVNFAFPSPAARAEVKVLVDYGTNVDAAVEALKASASRDDKILAKPEPSVRVSALSEGGIELAVAFDVTTQPEVADAENRVRRRVLERFAAQKIAIARRIFTAVQ